jgi:hypothetical protein
LDERVRERLVTENRGNPLALLELPRGSTPGELAVGFGLLDAPGLSRRIEDIFQRRFARLPVETQRLLLVAAAEPVGDPVLVWRAAGRLGIGGPGGGRHRRVTHARRKRDLSSPAGRECHKVCVRQERMESHAFNTRKKFPFQPACSDLYGAGGEPPGDRRRPLLGSGQRFGA